MRVLIDTGVLLRLLDRADPLHMPIRKALRNLRGRGDWPVTTAQNMSGPGGIGYGPERHDANGLAVCSPATPMSRSPAA